MQEQYTKKEYNKAFHKIDNAGDGNCLFYAVEMLDDRLDHKELRKYVCDYWKRMEKYYNTVESDKKLKETQKHYRYTHDKYELIKFTYDFIDSNGKEHKENICKNLVYASDTDIFLLAEVLRRPIIMYSYNKNTRKYVKYDAKEPGFFFEKNTINSNPNYNTPIYLDFNGKDHFQSLIPIDKSPSVSKSPSPKSKIRKSPKTSSKTRKSSKTSSNTRKSPKTSPKSKTHKSPKTSSKKSSPNTRKSHKTSSKKHKSPTEMEKYAELYGSNPDDYEEAIIQSLIKSTKNSKK